MELDMIVDGRSQHRQMFDVQMGQIISSVRRGRALWKGLRCFSPRVWHQIQARGTVKQTGFHSMGSKVCWGSNLVTSAACHFGGYFGLNR